jgi:hypothetical protein
LSALFPCHQIYFWAVSSPEREWTAFLFATNIIIILEASLSFLYCFFRSSSLLSSEPLVIIFYECVFNPLFFYLSVSSTHQLPREKKVQVLEITMQ